MERCSYFIENKALFGSFPTQQEVETLENMGVRCFIDLTSENENKTVPYTTKYKYIKYPITDSKIPEDWKSFAQLIVEVCRLIRNFSDERLYVHCRGGHGRSGIVVACILIHYYGLSPQEALVHTNKYHANRQEMKEKWRKLGSPQGKRQRDFVYRFYRCLKYGRPNAENSPNNWYSRLFALDNLSDHPVELKNIGTFKNAHLAFNYFRDPTNTDYTNKLLQGEFCPELVTRVNPDWEDKKIQYMATVLDNKFKQNPDAMNILLETGLQPLIKSSLDMYWGDGKNGTGKNVHGRLLMKLRVHYLHEDFISQR